MVLKEGPFRRKLREWREKKRGEGSITATIHGSPFESAVFELSDYAERVKSKYKLSKSEIREVLEAVKRNYE